MSEILEIDIVQTNEHSACLNKQKSLLVLRSYCSNVNEIDDGKYNFSDKWISEKTRAVIKVIYFHTW